MKNFFILSFFVVCGAVLMPIQAQAQVSAQSSSADIWAAVQEAYAAGWSDAQIAAAAEDLGISQSQIQAAATDAGGDAALSDRIDEAFAVAEKYPEESEPPVEIPPPPPPEEDSTTLTSVYNGVTYETDLATGNTTVAGSDVSIGYFDPVTGLYTDNSGGQVNISTLTGLAVSGTNEGGTVTTVVDGHSYDYLAAMWSAGYNYLEALASGDTEAMAAAVEAANLAVQTEAGTQTQTFVLDTERGTFTSDGSAFVDNKTGATYTIGADGSVYSSNGVLLGTYNQSDNTFTTLLQQYVSFYTDANGTIHYGCINTQNSSLTFPPLVSTSDGGGGPGTAGPTGGPDTGGPGGGGPGGGGPGVGAGQGVGEGQGVGAGGVPGAGGADLNGILATLAANPAIVNQGQSSTLYWNSTNATSCTGVGFTAGGPSGSRSTGALNDLGTHNYLVFCSSEGQNSPPAVASVEVLDPNASIAYLSANPLRVNSGERSTITWNLSNVRGCSITRKNVAWRSNLSTTGYVSDTITGPGATVYTMSNCVDSDGNVVPSSTVTVNLVPRLKEF